MRDDEAERPPARSAHPCGLPWCTTAHGATSHPADEDHRSDGRSMTLAVRSTGIELAPEPIEIEVGLLRRRSESRTWLVVEHGRGIAIELDVGSARTFLHTLAADPEVAYELGLASPLG